MFTTKSRHKNLSSDAYPGIRKIKQKRYVQNCKNNFFRDESTQTQSKKSINKASSGNTFNNDSLKLRSNKLKKISEYAFSKAYQLFSMEDKQEYSNTFSGNISNDRELSSTNKSGELETVLRRLGRVAMEFIQIPNNNIIAKGIRWLIVNFEIDTMKLASMGNIGAAFKNQPNKNKLFENDAPIRSGFKEKTVYILSFLKEKSKSGRIKASEYINNITRKLARYTNPSAFFKNQTQDIHPNYNQIE